MFCCMLAERQKNNNVFEHFFVPKELISLEKRAAQEIFTAYGH